MNKKIARKNARDNWSEYEQSVEKEREKKMNKAKEIVVQKNTQRAEELLDNLFDIGEEFSKVLSFGKNFRNLDGVLDFVDSYDVDDDYIEFYRDGNIAFYIPDYLYKTLEYGELGRLDFDDDGFNFNVISPEGSWSNQRSYLAEILASNSKIMAYIKNDCLPIVKKYLTDLKNAFKKTRLESLKEDKDELSIVGEFETGEDFGQKAGTSKKNQAIFRAKSLMKMKGLSRAKVVNAKGNVVWDSDTMLKEDKFIPQDKMSKKAQKELNDKKRGTWGNTNPVTRVQPNKKAYDRKRDKKTNLDEAKKGSKVYIAIGLEKGKEPKILGVYDSKEKANEQYKDSKMWVNISEQTVK
jgi:hypothetical protein